MKRLYAALTVGMILWLAGVANATVITFDDLETPGTGRWDFRSMQNYSYDGYNLTGIWPGSVGTFYNPLVYATQSSWGYAYPGWQEGSASMSLNSDSAWFELTRQDGGLFSFDSIRVRGFYAQQSSYIFNAYDSSDNLIATYTSGDTSTTLVQRWTTFTFDSSFDSVAKVLWRSYVAYDGYNSCMFADNIEVSSTASPVPEPATMLLFGAGIIGLAGVARRKRS